MGEFKNKIRNKLDECEMIRKDIDNIVNFYPKLKECDGFAKLVLLANGGVNRLDIDLSIEMIEEIINIIVDRYNGLLRDIQKETNIFIENCKREFIQ